MDLKVFLPEQLQRDAVALQFPVDVCAVRPDPVAHRRRAGKQLRLERRIVPVRPATASPTLVAVRFRYSMTVPTPMAQAWAIARWDNPWDNPARA